MKSEIKAYACYNKNEEVRLNSTSGGMFYLIAKYVIEQYGGIVYGAAFDENFTIKHIGVDRIEDIELLMGSKYPQSNNTNVYDSIKEYLSSGRTVLFSGTPCQVSGLCKYLDSIPTNLWLVDFVCHGVASPLVWRKYLNEYTNRNGLLKVQFKNKKYGWKHWHVNLHYKEKDIYEDSSQNVFMHTYLKGINVRPSCFSCTFKGINRISDFTIADSWGAGEQNAELNDNKGLSALLVHSNKGKALFKSIENETVFCEYLPNVLMDGNRALYESINESNDRRFFFWMLNRTSLKITMNSLKVRNKVYSIIFKVKEYVDSK